MPEYCSPNGCRLEKHNFVLLPIQKTEVAMSIFRVLLAIFFPPLAVIDRGCGSVLIVLILTCAGWVPGVIGALVILNKNE